MGKTLFWYLFRDLVRIFFLSAIVIAGIMSFGGLLRPLTHLGLDAWRVGQMWLYLMPAMMTYSMPIAAVFATSMVYGRLSADNELTACRAAGMSYKSVATPGLVLGMVAAITSLLFLSYVVPFFFLQAEKVGYANVARLIAANIERTHSFTIQRGKPTIFAQDAFLPPNHDDAKEQVLVLTRPAIIEFTRDPDNREINIPKNFSLAEEATLYIRQAEADQVTITGVLKSPTYFSRPWGPARTSAESRCSSGRCGWLLRCGSR